MSYEDKTANAARLLEAHYKTLNLSEEEITQKVLYFSGKLKELGATTEEGLRLLTWEDLEKDCALPRIIAKQVAEVFRVKPEEPKVTHTSARMAERMGPGELLGRYNPQEEDAVAKRLLDLSKGQPCIVFADGVVDAETSGTLLDEIRRGFPPRESIVVGGVPRRIYKVGERPDNLVDENPIYPGRPLRPDGTCDQTNRSWAGVPLSTRQLVRLAVEAGEIKVSIDKAHDILDMVMGTWEGEEGATRMSKLMTRFQKAGLRYQELKGTGNLPTLRIPLGGHTDRLQDPFYSFGNRRT